MRKLKVYFSFFFLASCFIVVTGCNKDPAFSNKEQQASDQLLDVDKVNSSDVIVANGSRGNITVAGGGTTLEFGKKTTYVFNAVQSQGKTSGHINLKFRAGNGALHINVDCLRLFGDNKATMSGIISQFSEDPVGSAPPFIFLGARVSFTVQDNGEGSHATADLVSDIGVIDMDTPASCADEMITYLPLDGNLQINK